MCCIIVIAVTGLANDPPSFKSELDRDLRAEQLVEVESVPPEAIEKSLAAESEK